MHLGAEQTSCQAVAGPTHLQWDGARYLPVGR